MDGNDRGDKDNSQKNSKESFNDDSSIQVISESNVKKCSLCDKTFFINENEANIRKHEASHMFQSEQPKAKKKKYFDPKVQKGTKSMYNYFSVISKPQESQKQEGNSGNNELEPFKSMETENICIGSGMVYAFRR